MTDVLVAVAKSIRSVAENSMIDFYNEKIHLQKLKESVKTSRIALNLESV